MVIKEAIQLAEKYAIEYPNTIWHIVDHNGFHIVADTYFIKKADYKKPSIYNTKTKILHNPGSSKYKRYIKPNFIDITKEEAEDNKL